MTAKTSPWPGIALWGLRVVVAVPFLGFGVMKLIGAPMLVHEFDMIGLGQGFRVFTGLVEITGALLLLPPRTSVYGGAILFCVSGGALAAEAGPLHGDVVHTLVLMVLTAGLVWAARGSLPRARRVSAA
jgi:hypothetical protein